MRGSVVFVPDLATVSGNIHIQLSCWDWTLRRLLLTHLKLPELIKYTWLHVNININKKWNVTTSFRRQIFISKKRKASWTPVNFPFFNFNNQTWKGKEQQNIPDTKTPVTLDLPSQRTYLIPNYFSFFLFLPMCSTLCCCIIEFFSHHI